MNGWVVLPDLDEWLSTDTWYQPMLQRFGIVMNAADTSHEYLKEKKKRIIAKYYSPVARADNFTHLKERSFISMICNVVKRNVMYQKNEWYRSSVSVSIQEGVLVSVWRKSGPVNMRYGFINTRLKYINIWRFGSSRWLLEASDEQSQVGKLSQATEPVTYQRHEIGFSVFNQRDNADLKKTKQNKKTSNPATAHIPKCF